ncbi:protein kinase [Synechococcales cyanobacterium C]|uniref:non-specific serine/threonine protein kinase n=1 Tax=Petrachloros mirabilis ULC683 TaxID=2781853 RepID=A0A8K2A9B5_9CYAN|nr:serine/threonine protein kinase [Petrachloros mirabilis]NCJ08094.1 protein kinase [Petrachloros mirabilis ULC683]
MPDAVPHSPVSRLLNHRYQVLQVLADGGFGHTYLAIDTQMPSGRKCVVKQLKPVENNDRIYQLVQERFQREAAILEALGEAHDQIPCLYAYFEEDGQFYLVEEWVEGDTLTQRVQKQGPLPEPQVLDILVKLLGAIAFIHQQQIVHRDLKPDNIILRQRDQQPVLIDFGAVKETMGTVINSQGQSSQSIVVGTPGFMPSEQMAGRPVYGSDLYSLGLTALYLLTGKLPQDLDVDLFSGDLRWRPLLPDLSPEFAAILDRALQMHPRDRFTNAPQMLAALDACRTLPDTEVVTHSVGTPTVPTEVVTPDPRGVAHPEMPTPLGQSMPSSLPTQPVMPQSANPQAAVPPVTTPQIESRLQSHSSTSSWMIAAILGSIIGTAMLVTAFFLQDQLPFLSALMGSDRSSPGSGVDPSLSPRTAMPPNTSPPDGELESSPSGTLTPEAEPSIDSPVNSDPPPGHSDSTPDPTGLVNATIVGEPGSKNIRSGPGTRFGVRHIAYPGDRVEILDSSNDSGGFVWHLIYFPQSQAQGWIAAQLIQQDGASPPPQSPPQTPPPSTPTPDTNATIGGEPGSKNIRSGPGTNFGVRHIAYPGDRVRILNSEQDNGGFVWYEIYFPKSGAKGWIAAQLLSVD